MAKRSVAEKRDEAVIVPHPREVYGLHGHEQAEHHVLRLFNSGRLPHALLISGSRGIGKATLAYRIARFLLSPKETSGGLFGDALEPESLYVAQQSETSKRIEAGSHSDLLVLEGEDIKVDDVRAVPTFLSMTPAESNWRVVIIDSAEAMNQNAANALLKTLEEPPARTLLMLISHNPGILLPTIRSRCRMLRLSPLHEKYFSQVLTVIAPEISTDERHALAVLSNGSAGVALLLHAEGGESLYRDILSLLVNPDTAAMHGFADRMNRKGSEPQFHIFNLLIPWLITRVCAHQRELQPEVFAGERDMLDSLLARKPQEFWLEQWDKANELLRNTENLYLDKKQAVITLMRALAA